MTNLRHRAVSVVSQRLNQQRHATWAITFIGDLFVVDAFFFTGATTDRAVDRIVRHVAALGIEDRLAQTCVGVWIATATTRGDGDFLDEFGKQFAALGIERAFLVLDTMPFRMSGHLSLIPSGMWAVRDGNISQDTNYFPHGR